MSTPRDEAAKRRPGFSEGRRAKLGDGQEWTFPSPTVRFHPARADGGGFKVVGSPPYGREYQAMFDRLLDSTGDSPADNEERHNLRLCMAAELLCRNYDLDDDDLEALLPLQPGEENVAMWGEIYYILIGLGAPKA